MFSTSFKIVFVKMADQTNYSKEESENSDDNLQIVVESPSRKRKPPPIPTELERKIIESIEEELERQLDEKAAKTNLNAVHVKNIIRHVVTNEHVLNLFRNAENKAGENSAPPFEPKWTRSKAKELCCTPGLPIPSVSWVAPKASSEVQVLFSEDLQEDSSGDEYIPGMADEERDEEKDESEDDPDSSFLSDPPSIEPPTPPEPLACSSPSHVPQICSSPPPTLLVPAPSNDSDTFWSEDGIFKIPSLPKDKEETVAEATIAKRTRSKLCLSSTPLEVIEEAFMPPDITTDMYEMDCDNEDWKNFLKTFTRPLEEVDKIPEEEELDPEYNVLSDEEGEKPDKEELREELRVDKAVKVSRKELNALMAELYEFCSIEQAHLDNVEDDEIDATTYLDSQLTSSDTFTCTQKEGSDNVNELHTEVILKEEFDPNLNSQFEQKQIITDIQIRLLKQQLRQHVQLLTQNFLLTYQHPELHEHSEKTKEYLLNLKLLGEGKHKSTFITSNLEDANRLVNYWEDMFKLDTDAVKKMKEHIDQTTYKSLQCKQVGTEYIVTFPPLLLETISKSTVFLYPSLLPKIPFKPPRYFSSARTFFFESELHLIAMGLEQFMPIVVDVYGVKLTKKKSVQLVSRYIHEYMLPIKKSSEISTKIHASDFYRCGENPIKYYFRCNKAPNYLQYYMPLEDLQIIPPCRRKAEELPFQWRTYIFPGKNISELPKLVINPNATIEYKVIPQTSVRIQKTILPKGLVVSAPLCPRQRKKRLKRVSPRKCLQRFVKQDPITRFIEVLSRPSNINKALTLFSTDFDLNSLIKNVCTVNSKDKRTANVKTKDKKLCTNDSSPNQGNNHKKLSTDLNKVDDKRKDKDSIMLRNMPSLYTPVKIDCQNEESNSAGEGKDVDLAKKNISLEISEVGISNFPFMDPVNIQKEHSESSGQDNKVDPKDTNDEQTIPAVPNLTVKTPKKEISGPEKKRAKLKKEYLANLAVSTPETPVVEKQKNEMFALAYYDKMRETLEIEAYHKVIQILNDYVEGDAIDLYYKIEPILRPKYKELADEFLLFLREREAAAVDRLIPWIQMNNRSKFLRKLEVFFKDQPSQLRKIYQCLTELSQTTGVSMEKIKTTLVPMFKGNAVLTDLFIQNFLEEPPPTSLIDGPYEFIDVNKELSQNEHDEPFETITVPDVEDKYGTSTCICNCHEIEDVEFKTRFRHCSRCGTKFINGSVYIQTGRGLRPATVSFLSSSPSHNHTRLKDRSLSNLFQRKKRLDSTPSKQVSHSSLKDNPDEETDEDGDKKKKPKRKPRTKKPKTIDNTHAKGTLKKTTSKSRNLNKEFKSNPRKRTYSIKKSNASLKTEQVGILETEVEEQIETEIEEHVENEQEEQVETELEEQAKPGCSKGQLKRLHEESCEEGDQNEVKLLSPEQHTAESESEFCEESSQDNCESDSNSSTSSNLNRRKSYADVFGENSSWQREEDKIILEVFQMENDKDHAFRAIANQLKGRTVDDIKSRFDTLMELLLKTVEDHRD